VAANRDKGSRRHPAVDPEDASAISSTRVRPRYACAYARTAFRVSAYEPTSGRELCRRSRARDPPGSSRVRTGRAGGVRKIREGALNRPSSPVPVRPALSRVHARSKKARTGPLCCLSPLPSSCLPPPPFPRIRARVRSVVEPRDGSRHARVTFTLARAARER